jgi:hypothetical protein
MAAHTMACTLSNRETFVVMCWLDEEPARLARLQSEGQRLLRKGFEAALPHLSDLIYDELRRDLPDMDGVVGALLGSGLSRVNFLELAHALLLEVSAPKPAAQAVKSF